MTRKLRKPTSAFFPASAKLFILLVAGLIGLSACGGGQKGDPLVATYPLAYVKKPMPTAANNLSFESALNPAPTNPNYGSQLIIRDAPLIGAKETTVAPPLSNTGATRRWDVKDLEFSDDGSKLLFAAHLEPLSVSDTQTWDIYQYDFTTRQAKPVIQTTTTAIEGDDVSPHYLLDGRIVFSSSRNTTTRYKILDQGSSISGTAPVTEGSNGSTVSFKLHVMDRNGLNIKQITFGTSHDLFPSMMRTGTYSGKIIFSRWDTKGTSDHRMHLYMINPDGTNEQYIYGWNSHNTGTANDTIHFTKPMQLSDGRILSIIRHNNGTFNGGDLVSIDISNFIDNTTPVASKAGLTGPAQTSLTAGLGGTLTTLVAQQGKFNSVAPFYDGTNKAIVSYGSCYVFPSGQTTSVPCDDTNVAATGATVAPPRYYVGVFTLGNNVLQPLTKPDPDFYYSDVAIAQDKAQPNFIADTPVTAGEARGILHIRNVLPGNVIRANYLSDTAAYIRIYKHTYMDDTVAMVPEKVGVNASRKMRELVGYAPIETDGSVRVRVPGDVPLSFQIVNANFQAIGTNTDHPVWITVKSGEDRTCNGCHVTTTPATPHGRFDAETAVNSGTTVAQSNTAGDPATMNPLIDYGTMDPRSGSGLGILNQSGCIDFAVPANNQTNWLATCRIIINYANLHPLWQDPMTNSLGKNCVSCHTPTQDANGGDTTPGHLNLTVAGTNNTLTNYNAYTNLISGTYQLFNATTMALDPPISRTTIVPGSATSSAFLYKRDVNGNVTGTPRFGTNVSHPTVGGTMSLLSDGEVKMITEWIDNGAQYQNHP